MCGTLVGRELGLVLLSALCLPVLFCSCYYDFGSMNTNSQSSSDSSTTDSQRSSDTTQPSSDSDSHSETDTSQTDTGTETSVDSCPQDPDKTEPGWCGCGQPEGTCPGIAISQATYNVQDSIVVKYWSLPGNMLDWVGVFQKSEENDNWDSFEILLGQTEGTLTFVGLPPGEYEARLFFNDNDADMDRIPFNVVRKNTEVIADCTADAFVDKSQPLVNSGATETLFVSSDPLRQSLLRFTVPSLAAPIERVLLRIMTTSTFNVVNGPRLFGADNTWDEIDVTWNSLPARGEAHLADFQKLARLSWNEISITGGLFNADTYTIVLVPDGVEESWFSSREGHWKPYLLIVTAE